MSTYAELQTAITDVSKNKYIVTDSSITIASRINTAVTEIAGGVRMPSGEISPPLPYLFDTDTIATTANAYADLPDTYHRNLFYVSDSSGFKIEPVRGGNYYSFMLFLKQATKKDLSASGPVSIVCVKGDKLYYQAIPSVSTNLSVMFYRKPVDMTLDSDTPDGIPEHLQLRLIKHRVGYNLANDMVDGTERMIQYHEKEFYKAMQDLIDFVGYPDAEPEYYGNDMGFIDYGVCDR